MTRHTVTEQQLADALMSLVDAWWDATGRFAPEGTEPPEPVAVVLRWLDDLGHGFDTTSGDWL